ncbi:MAG: hypothetical protein EU539_06275 [Promethearchaeota archaeon]|nr:MAG: hypothetical protein EU539_06275 [Candidatus Lokiarchaeota archaeon]
MIKSILISDSEGYVFYSKILDRDMYNYDSVLLSGFISAIGSVGRELFKEEIATISFGYEQDSPGIVVLTKDFFGTEKKIYFVFVTHGDIDLKMIKDVCTNIYINNKADLKASGVKKNIHGKIDRIVQLNLIKK